MSTPTPFHPLHCPACGSRVTGVISGHDAGMVHKRRRECKFCGRRFNTVEEVVIAGTSAVTGVPPCRVSKRMAKFRVWSKEYGETRAMGIDVEAGTIGLAAVEGQKRADEQMCVVTTQPIEWMVFTPLSPGKMDVVDGMVHKVTVRGREVVVYEHEEAEDAYTVPFSSR